MPNRIFCILLYINLCNIYSLVPLSLLFYAVYICLLLYTGGLADMCDLKRPIPSLAEAACEQVREGKDAFSPSTETVAIHMW